MYLSYNEDYKNEIKAVVYCLQVYFVDLHFNLTFLLIEYYIYNSQTKSERNMFIKINEIKVYFL